MKKSYILIRKKIVQEKKKYFENIDFYAKKIKRLAQKILGKESRVLLFGSIVRGDWGPNSDIDVLIISDKLSKKWEENRHLRTKIKSSIGFFAPFQLHLVKSEEFENWYKKFIGQDYKEIN